MGSRTGSIVEVYAWVGRPSLRFSRTFRPSGLIKEVDVLTRRFVKCKASGSDLGVAQAGEANPRQMICEGQLWRTLSVRRTNQNPGPFKICPCTDRTNSSQGCPCRRRHAPLTEFTALGRQLISIPSQSHLKGRALGYYRSHFSASQRSSRVQ